MKAKELRVTSIEEVFKRMGVVFCPTCKVGYWDKLEKTFINEIGECSSCDHISGEVLNARM